MKESLSTRVLRALGATSISPHDRQVLFNAIVNPSKSDPEIIDVEWDALVASAKQAKLSLTSNKPKWSVRNAAMYAEYVAIIDTAISRIQKASLLTREEGGARVKLADITQKMRGTNARNVENGLPTRGNCDARWQSWVPDIVRSEFVAKINLHYQGTNSVKLGNRLIPFAPVSLRKDNKARVARMVVAIQNVRRTATGDSSGKTLATTPYAALYLAAARQAELVLGAYIKETLEPGFNAYERPCMVSWEHLLEPEMRARLRAAKENAQRIVTDDLSHFLQPTIETPENVDEALAEIALDEEAWQAPPSKKKESTKIEEVLADWSN